MGSRIFPAIAILLLAACGSESPSPSSAAAPAAPSAAAPASGLAEQPAEAPASTPAEQPADAPTEVALADAATRPETPPAALERRFEEGRHYERLRPQQPTVTAGDGRVEVVEIFQYSCPACFAFEPYIGQWKEAFPDYVSFTRLPAPWNSLSELHARAYYTAETLGILDEIHSPFFREIHVNGNYLQSEDELAAFFAKFGVDEATFEGAFNSFAVHTKLQRSRDLVQRYRITGTPEIVIAGKYRTGGTMAQSYENWLAIINELAAVEYAAANQ